MKFEDLPLNVPVLIQVNYAPNFTIEYIRIDRNLVAAHWVSGCNDNNWDVYPSTAVTWGSIIDSPLDEDAAECGVYKSGKIKYKFEYGQCIRDEIKSWSGIEKTVQKEIGEACQTIIQEMNICNCDFVTQILPYGCKCGGK